jgi:transcriptional regulator GlxA family with amidase domain
MKHISIIVPRGAAAVSCLEGSYKLFTQVNELLIHRGDNAIFKVQLVGLDTTPQLYDKFFTIEPDLTVNDNFKTDLIIIPAVNGEMDKVIAANSGFFPWITKQYKQGAEVASLCVGAFLLAGTGLVTGKKCSTHWLSVNTFRNMFPDVELVPEKIITDEHGIYSSGGANSFYNLLLYILEKYTNRELAIYMAKYFEIELDRHNQSSFIMFSGQKDHDDEPVRKAQEFIEGNFADKIVIEELAGMLALGRRSLERRFKKATNNTVVEYIQRVKIEAAKKELEVTRKKINELMCMKLVIQIPKHSARYLRK